MDIYTTTKNIQSCGKHEYLLHTLEPNGRTLLKHFYFWWVTKKLFLLGRILSTKSRNAVQIRHCLPDFSNVSLEVT